MARKEKGRSLEERWAKPMTLEDALAEFSPEEQKEMQARAENLASEEMTLQEMRKALSLSQAAIAEKMGVSQESISRMENRNDVLVSTLQDYVAAAGLELELIVRAPGKPPIKISGLGELAEK